MAVEGPLEGGIGCIHGNQNIHFRVAGDNERPVDPADNRVSSVAERETSIGPGIDPWSRSEINFAFVKDRVQYRAAEGGGSFEIVPLDFSEHNAIDRRSFLVR